MSTNSRNKNLLFIIAVLLLTNIAVLVYFLALRKPGERRGGTSDRSRGLTEMLQKEVGFNENQVAQYETLKTAQRERIRPMFDEMRKAKDSLFRLMSDSTVSDSIINKAADAIAQKQRMLDLQAFNHFRRVRALCVNAEQQVKYDSAVLRMFRKMGKPARRGEAEKQEKK
jgi:protein CpxP